MRYTSFKKWFRKHETILLIVLSVLEIKLCLFLWAYFNFDFNTNYFETPLSIWNRWDGHIYTTIAHTWYNFIGIDYGSWSFLSNFPPLYSLAMQIIARIFFLSLPVAGVLVSLGSIILASIFLYKLVYLEFKDSKKALLSVLFLNVFPTSYFTMSVYSESLFLLVTILFFYFLKKEKYLFAGFLVSLAVLTRFVGIVLVPIFFWYVIKKYGYTVKSGYLLLISLLGLGMYFLINKLYFASYFYFFTEKVSFDATKFTIIPFSETITSFLLIFNPKFFMNTNFMMTQGWNAVFTLFAVAMSLLSFKRLPRKYAVFSLLSVMLFASLSWGISNARYTLSVFPIFMTLATIKNKYIIAIILILFISGLLYFSELFTRGAWAF